MANIMTGMIFSGSPKTSATVRASKPRSRLPKSTYGIKIVKDHSSQGFPGHGNHYDNHGHHVSCS